MKRILIIDDAMYIRTRIREIAERVGFSLAGQASDGFEAIDQIRSMKPDVITLDLTMPFMNGLEVLEKVKWEFPLMKVVVVAANGSEQKVREAVLMGADFFVMKPFEDSDVERILETLYKE